MALERRGQSILYSARLDSLSPQRGEGRGEG